MATSYEFGLYDATVLSAMITTREAKDSDTGQMVTKEQLEVEVQLNVLRDKQGNETEVEGNKTARLFRAMSGGNLEGKGLEITKEWLIGIAGEEIFNQYGLEAFTDAGSEMLKGRSIKVLASPGNNPKYPVNFSVFNGKERATNESIDRTGARRLNSLFGVSPSKKVGDKPKAETPAASDSTSSVAKDSFI